MENHYCVLHLTPLLTWTVLTAVLQTRKSLTDEMEVCVMEVLLDFQASVVRMTIGRNVLMEKENVVSGEHFNRRERCEKFFELWNMCIDY